MIYSFHFLMPQGPWKDGSRFVKVVAFARTKSPVRDFWRAIPMALPQTGQAVVNQE
jgi:hypothetical protein